MWSERIRVWSFFTAFVILKALACEQNSTNCKSNSELSQANEILATDLYKIIFFTEQTKNFMVLVTSVQMILSLLLIGSNGDTAEELNNILHYKNLSQCQLLQQMECFRESVENLVDLKMFIKIYISEGSSFNQSFQKLLKSFSTENTNLEKAKKTAEIIDNKATETLKMLIVSTFIFHKEWQFKFDTRKNDKFAEFYVTDERTERVVLMQILV